METNFSYFFNHSLILDSPHVMLMLGRNLNLVSIIEGMDVYLECQIDANPKPTKIQWIHNVNYSQNDDEEPD